MFDGAAEDAAAQVGFANVPLGALDTVHPREVCGFFALTHPETQEPAGQVHLQIKWLTMLLKQPTTEPALAAVTRVPASDAALPVLDAARLGEGETVMEIALVDASITVRTPAQRLNARRVTDRLLFRAAHRTAS